jgi:DNA-binding MarR family transcriptional regulator
MMISALVADLVMDRTTLGRNLQLLERAGLVAVVKGRSDRRSPESHLTETGAERLRTAVEGWVKAPAGFEAVFGEQRSAELRRLLHAVSGSQLKGVSPKRLAERTAGLGVTGPPAVELLPLQAFDAR